MPLGISSAGRDKLLVSSGAHCLRAEMVILVTQVMVRVSVRGRWNSWRTVLKLKS